jgi:putative ABC transport system permease protein
MPDIESSTPAFRLITPGYFKALGIPLLRGRLFEATDAAGTEPAIVIDEALARKYFPNQDPIGRRIGGSGDGWAPVIGVVGSVAHAGLTDAPIPGHYLLYEQSSYMSESISLLLRVNRNRALASTLQQAVNTIQSTVPVAGVVSPLVTPGPGSAPDGKLTAGRSAAQLRHAGPLATLGGVCRRPTVSSYRLLPLRSSP